MLSSIIPFSWHRTRKENDIFSLPKVIYIEYLFHLVIISNINLITSSNLLKYNVYIDKSFFPKDFHMNALTVFHKRCFSEWLVAYFPVLIYKMISWFSFYTEISKLQISIIIVQYSNNTSHLIICTLLLTKNCRKKWCF